MNVLLSINLSTGNIRIFKNLDLKTSFIVSTNMSLISKYNGVCDFFAILYPKNAVKSLLEDAKTKSQNEWTLYPNPNSGSFSVHSLNISNALDIYLVDILGRSIDAQITINKASNSIDFVLSEARSGYYFVIINNESGDNARLKFNINE